MPKYAMMWLTIEVIVLPVIYYLGYEPMMKKQEDDFDKSFDIIFQKAYELEKENQELRLKNKLFVTQNRKS